MKNRIMLFSIRSFKLIALGMAISSFACTLLLSNQVVGQEVGSVKQASLTRQQMIDRAVGFLRKAQAEDGSFSNNVGPGITGLVLHGLVVSGLPEDDPMVDKAAKYLLSTKREDGGLYATGSKHANYETCLAMMALVKLNRNKYESVVDAAEAFVKGQQWDEGEGLESSDPAFGGAGYGSKSRPDLSNTSFLIEALRDAGCTEDDPAIQRALAFVSRCQNLESPHNNTPFANKSNDGGFYYTSAAGGDSMAGKDEATGALRSYASMSYAGLKSMVFAGVNADDVRVRAVKSFLKKNYSVSTNPGMGEIGLYYYQQTMSKALAALGGDTFETQSGIVRWKEDLLEQLSKTQRPDGSWVNPQVRWMEGDPNLVTGYALLTLGNLK
jgi:squalene-hopene/tetraprenyl-beta-curcumene cyclase